MGDQCELEGQSFKFWLHASSVWKSRSFFSVIHWKWRIDKLCCCTNNVQQCIGYVLASPLHRKSKYCNIKVLRRYAIHRRAKRRYHGSGLTCLTQVLNPHPFFDFIVN